MPTVAPASMAELSALVELPTADGEVVFREPWEAQVFALVVSLHDRGVFAWKEWAECLAAARSAAHRDHAATEHVFEDWAAALERMIAGKGFASAAQIEAWHEDFVRKSPAPHQHKARREPVCVA